MNKKKFLAMMVACGLIMGTGIAGTMAYLSDHTEATNNFTFGDVKVDTLEPDWDLTDEDGNGIPDVAENETPNQQTPKSVQCENVGINDAIVFVKITVPVENVTRVAPNGTAERKSDGSLDRKPQEIFYFQGKNDTVNTLNNNFNANWVNLPEEEVGYAGSGGATEYLDLSTTKSYNQNYRTYVFGYNKRLRRDEKTNTLFDKVQIKNFVENEITPSLMKQIKVETYSIQADNIVNQNGTIGTMDTLHHDTLKEIYDIYVTQNPEYR